MVSYPLGQKTFFLLRVGIANEGCHRNSSSAVDVDFLFKAVVVAVSFTRPIQKEGGTKNALGQNFATETVQGKREGGGAFKLAKHLEPD